VAGGPVDIRGELGSARADRRRARRRHLGITSAGIAMGVAAAVVIGLLLTDTLRIGGDRPALAERREPSTAPPTTVPSARACRSPLTSDDPLRLWIGGDSFAGSLGPALGEQAAGTGIVAPIWDARPSSGLADPSFFDWPAHATETLPDLDPEVVVFIMGTNDYTTPRSTPVDAAGEPAWKAMYSFQVAQMLDVLSDHGHRTVYWLGGPTMRDPAIERGVVQINEVIESVVAKHKDAHYVDVHEIFAGPDGGWSATMPGENGKPVRVRTSDGVHLTPAGGDLLGRAVFERLAARCHLLDQADPDHPQKVKEAPGSSLVPPGVGAGTPTGAGGTGHTGGTGGKPSGTPVTSAPTQPATQATQATTPSSSPGLTIPIVNP